MADIIKLLSELITTGAAVGVVLAAVARFIPNDKLYYYGAKCGNYINSFGERKIGTVVWEKIEDFLVNSVGEFLRGFKFGLDNIYTGKVKDDIRT